MYRTSLPSHDPTESRFSWPAVSSRNLKFAKSQVEGLKSQNHLIAHAHLKMPFESSYIYIYIYIYNQISQGARPTFPDGALESWPQGGLEASTTTTTKANNNNNFQNDDKQHIHIINCLRSVLVGHPGRLFGSTGEPL